MLDYYENNTYDIQNELEFTHPGIDLKCVVANIRDEKRLAEVFNTYKPDILFHAAAHKHVPMMEENPSEAVKNNILGTLNLVRVADKNNLKKFILISTDKAVNPTSVMGTTKRVCEMIIQTYGVVPLFKKQIAMGGPVTVTHPDIKRYFVTIPEAVQLVIQAGAMASGGEIFVLDMGEPVKIIDLAKDLIIS